MLLLTLLNQHVTISLARIQPSTHAGVAAAEVASAAAQVRRARRDRARRDAQPQHQPHT